MQTKVSVILLMLTYNHEECIEESIKSILNQDFHDFELRIIDDCSQDSTYELLQELATRDDRIKIHRNTSNLGMFQNFLNNLESIEKVAKYEYFAWIGPDDSWERSWLSKCVDKLASDQISAVCQSFVEYQTDSNVEIRRYENISGVRLYYSDSINLRSGYGELMHGLWRRATVRGILSDSKILPMELMLKLENFFVGLLISKGGFSVVPEVLHTKNKRSGSKFRYKQDRFFQNPNRIFLKVIRSTFSVTVLGLREGSKIGFLLGSWLIDLRISLPMKVSKNV